MLGPNQINLRLYSNCVLQNPWRSVNWSYLLRPRITRRIAWETLERKMLPLRAAGRQGNFAQNSWDHLLLFGHVGCFLTSVVDSGIWNVYQLQNYAPRHLAMFSPEGNSQFFSTGQFVICITITVWHERECNFYHQDQAVCPALSLAECRWCGQSSHKTDPHAGQRRWQSNIWTSKNQIQRGKCQRTEFSDVTQNRLICSLDFQHWRSMVFFWTAAFITVFATQAVSPKRLSDQRLPESFCGDLLPSLDSQLERILNYEGPARTALLGKVAPAMDPLCPQWSSVSMTAQWNMMTSLTKPLHVFWWQIEYNAWFILPPTDSLSCCYLQPKPVKSNSETDSIELVTVRENSWKMAGQPPLRTLLLLGHQTSRHSPDMAWKGIVEATAFMAVWRHSVWQIWLLAQTETQWFHANCQWKWNEAATNALRRFP